jgi:tRNA 2-thiouridine synthesizing protein A
MQYYKTLVLARAYLNRDGGAAMSADIKVDQVLDAKGLSCPLPILKTKKAVEALSKDQVLKVETTDPGSKNDMASWAKRTGNEILKVEEGSGTFTFFIKKTA